MKKLLRTFVILILCFANQYDCIGSTALKSTDKAIRNTITVSSTVATPDAPTNLVVTPINTGGMIQFTAPANDGGSAITNYEYSTDDGASWITPSPAVTESPLIISSGLTNCTTYQVKIRAVNTSGSGAASIAVSLNPRTSTFGTDWIRRTPSAINSWIGITYGNGLFVAVGYSGSGNRVMTSPDGITWTSRTSAVDNDWQSVTYGNGLFVAVANTGTGNRVMTSPDGITWTSRTSAADNNWTGVTYGNGLFVAVATTGTGNRVMISADGITWTASTSAADNDWKSVTYGNNLFVAVAKTGTGNRVMISADGITWTASTSAADNDWQSVTYGNGLFVAVSSTGTGNRVMTSLDGITWTSRTSATDNYWTGVTYGNGLFVATQIIGDNTIMVSADGINWTSRNSLKCISITYGNGLFVAIDNSALGYIVTSTYSIAADAPVITSISPRNNAARVSFTQTVPLSAQLISNYEYSIDNGSTWTAASPTFTSSSIDITGLSNGTSYTIKIRAINSVGPSCVSNTIEVTPALGTVPNAPTSLVLTNINNGGLIQFAAPVSDGGSTITNYDYSTDNGNTWTTPSPAISTSPLIISSGLVNCTAYQVKLRAVNANGSGSASSVVTLTPNTSIESGISWISRTSASDNTWTSITYGNGLFVAVSATGTGNRVMTSPDGIIWTSRTSATDNYWTGVTYGNGLFVAVSTSGTGNRVMTSPDGIIWTSKTSATDNSWTTITYGNGLFVAVANGIGNKIMTSPDGITWTSRLSADNSWASITYGNGLFVAVSSAGSNGIMTSTDGVTWITRVPPVNISLRSVSYGNGLFVAVASTGTGKRVMTSPNGITWTSRTSAADNSWRSVAYGNGLFVAVANTGIGNRVMTSPDGISWTSRTSAAGNSWVSVIYGNGVFVAVATSGTGNRVMTSSFSPVADTPVITSAPVSGTTATVAFTQSISAFAPAISNYQYSIDNGASWTVLSPAATTSPITISSFTEATNQIQLQAINSVGNSCPAIYLVVGSNLNKYGQKTSTSSEFINKNGALGLWAIRSTGESIAYSPALAATDVVTVISATTASSGGSISSDRGATVTARGVCWSITTKPTTADSKTTDGTGTGTFTSAISGLITNTTYYVRSYATNSIGTTYGQEVSFTTL